MTLIKICGITNLDDARAAISAGADALGFNFYKPSPRYIAPKSAREIIAELPGSVLTVGVFVNEDSASAVAEIADEAGVKAVQLHGDESPSYCRELATHLQVIKTFVVADTFDIEVAKAYEVDAIMLDSRDSRLRGGTGRTFDWTIAECVARSVPKLFLAGGLSPENVAVAIETVRPFAVDACSSLEQKPGVKSHERMRDFVAAVRSVKP